MEMMAVSAVVKIASAAIIRLRQSTGVAQMATLAKSGRLIRFRLREKMSRSMFK